MFLYVFLIRAMVKLHKYMDVDGHPRMGHIMSRKKRPGNFMDTTFSWDKPYNYSMNYGEWRIFNHCILHVYSPIIFCQGDKPDAGKPSPRHAQTLTQEMQGTEVSGGGGVVSPVRGWVEIAVDDLGRSGLSWFIMVGVSWKIPSRNGWFRGTPN